MCSRDNPTLFKYNLHPAHSSKGGCLKFLHIFTQLTNLALGKKTIAQRVQTACLPNILEQAYCFQQSILLDQTRQI